MRKSVGTSFSNPYVSAKLFPLEGKTSHYIRLKSARGSAGALNGELAVPPKELWVGYGRTAEEYLALGRDDVAVMRDVLAKAGAPLESLRRALELGCAAARMLRFYPYKRGESELWGVDISARHISWCQEHLSPPFLFATITTCPHLPFEDNYFDLVYCGSVFTHISDLPDAWFLELRRVLRKDGYVYITIHDKTSLDLLLTKYKDDETAADFIETVRRFDQETAIRSHDYAWFSLSSGPDSHVFYDSGYLVERWSRLARVLAVVPEAYGWQTALLFQK